MLYTIAKVTYMSMSDAKWIGAHLAFLTGKGVDIVFLSGYAQSDYCRRPGSVEVGTKRYPFDF